MNRYGGPKKQEKEVACERPYNVLRRCGFDAEASAVNIDSARKSETEGPQEADQEQIGEHGRARQTPTAQDECPRIASRQGSTIATTIYKRPGRIW